VALVAAVVLAVGCTSSKTTSANTATFYRDRACADWAAAIHGAQTKTMTSTEVAAKLGKMADNAKSVSLFDTTQASWPDAINRLRVDLLANDTASVSTDGAAAKGPC